MISYKEYSSRFTKGLIIGQAFSSFYSDMLLIKILTLSKDNDILSVWKMGNQYFGYYIDSGIRAITGKLALILISE